MKLHIVARGKIGRGPEADLIARYAKRIAWPLVITELPDVGSRAPDPPPQTNIVALDEGGTAITSVGLADRVVRWRDEGVREVRFLIGAADGLTSEERASADLVFSFGAATWPHLLVRAMLVEQLYRATTIIAGHPYHREG